MVKAFLAFWKGLSCTSVHTKSLRVLSRGLRGARIFDIWLVLDANWFVSPKNDLRSVRLPGVGKFDMAVVMSLSFGRQLESCEWHFGLKKSEFFPVQ